MKPKEIIFHASATPADMHAGWDAAQWVAEIDRWHRERGWNGIGYHWVVARNGTIAKGRPMNKQGAHVKGHNKNTVGICLVGPGDKISSFHDHFTEKQLVAVSSLIRIIEDECGTMKLSGHNDYTSSKTCPGFKVGEFNRELRFTEPKVIKVENSVQITPSILGKIAVILTKLLRRKK